MTQPYPPPMPYYSGVPQNPPGEVPLDKPYYGISFGGAFKRFFTKYATFSGRASRSEYWWSYLAIVLISLGLLVLAFVAQGATAGFEDDDDPTPLFLVLIVVLVVFFLGVLVPGIAVSVRRLHDANMSGWMLLLSLIPYVGGIIQIVLMCQGTKPEGARFDEDRGGYGYPPGYGGPGYAPPGYPPQQYPPGYPPPPPADPYGQPPA